MEHNLVGTLNLLELCKRRCSGFVLLSTSRVYSLAKLSRLPVIKESGAFVPAPANGSLPGLSSKGVSEVFSTEAPVSLYGSAKLASETIALDYASAFGFPLFINRCGVLAGAGQFGKPDQGIFSFWIHSYRNRRPLKYVGFAGSGYQVRDCLHPQDLAGLLASQLRCPERTGTVLNVSGGMMSSTSLFQLSQWCGERFGNHPIGIDAQERPFDVPWLVLDSSKAEQVWDWQPRLKRESIFEEIAQHADENPHWLELSAGT
jgi:CDP-paratose 2-epimerase